MIQYTFIVPGNPHAKHRPRFSRYSNHAYTDASDHSYERYVKECFRYKYPLAEPIETAVSVCVVAYFKIPVSTVKSKRALMETETYPHTVKPDADNVLKAVLDGCNGIVWLDDRLVSDVSIQKRYSLKPRTEITITGGHMT